MEEKYDFIVQYREMRIPVVIIPSGKVLCMGLPRTADITHLLNFADDLGHPKESLMTGFISFVSRINGHGEPVLTLSVTSYRSQRLYNVTAEGKTFFGSDKPTTNQQSTDPKGSVFS